jgi:hypothetical protein
MNQFSPSPRVFHKDRFEFFRKFAEIFLRQGIEGTGGKFATGVNDTGGKKLHK